MNFHHFSIVALALSLLFACTDEKNTASDLTPYEWADNIPIDSAYSKINNTGNGFEIENHTYHLHQYHSSHQFIFEINEKQTLSPNNNLKNVAISPLWTTTDAPNWAYQFEVSDYSFQNQILTTETSTRWEKEETFSLYNIENGTHLLDYTYAKMDVQFSAKDEKRFVGFYSQMAENDLNFEDNFFGLITYSSLEEKKQQLLISILDTANLNFITQNTPDMNFAQIDSNAMLLNGDKTLYFSNTDKISSVDFDIELTAYLTEDYESIHFMIPIRNDAILFDSIQYYQEIFSMEIVK